MIKKRNVEMGLYVNKSFILWIAYNHIITQDWEDINYLWHIKLMKLDPKVKPKTCALEENSKTWCSTMSIAQV